MTATQTPLSSARERWVARGVSAPAIEAVGAKGATVTGADGVEYLDFAGGIGCQNLGHAFGPLLAAVHDQVDRYLHQCVMVGSYEPYLEVCRRLAELSPCRGDRQKSLLVNSGAEAVENAVKIARHATGRPGVVVFDNAFHGRTLLTMTMTDKVVYRRGFGPFAPEVYRVAAPYRYRGITSDDSLAALARLFHAQVDPAAVACVVLEPVQGEGGFVVMPPDFPARLRELCDRHGILWVDDEVQAGTGRTGRVWAVEHYEGAEPDLLVSGKSLGGGLPLAAVTGRAEVMDAVHPGGVGGTFGGNPLSCAAAAVVLDTVAEPGFQAAALALGERLRERLDGIASRVPGIGDVRGLGPMLALELEERTPDRASVVVDRAFDRGLLLLSCGLDGNVIRLLPPLTIPDDELELGLELLEEALAGDG
jgi:4-aminobutyrate aminotransferase / (S)-3-amino-2-methylpropionate transaminase / 5-aminovalerate transaminase